MADFIIVTDSSADLPQELMRERGVTVVPFYVMTEGDYVRQHLDIEDGDFYQWMLDNPGKFPKSSAPSVSDYLALFTKFAEAGEKVVCICITRKFSASYQNACIARTMLKENWPRAAVEVIDATVNTVLQGQLVAEACDLRDAGVSMAEAVKALEEVKPTGRIFFTIGGIEYLQIGGRIGKLAGKVGSVLGLRPIITLREGEIHPSGVVRGRAKSLERVLTAAEQYLRENFTSAKDLSISVGYGYDYEEAVSFRERAVALLEKLGLAAQIPIYRIGAVIGVHTGPHPLGLGILRKVSVCSAGRGF